MLDSRHRRSPRRQLRACRRWLLTRGVLVASLLCCLSVDRLQAQATVYVDANAGGPTHNGTSWCSAFLLLQDALAAAGAGDTIRVANGTYTPDQGGAQTPGDRLATFRLLVGVSVEGGYAGCGAANPDARDFVTFETILSGDLLGNDGPSFANNNENSLHVVTGAADPSAVLDGFTVSGGNANSDEISPDGLYGAGVFNFTNGSTIIRCKLTGNFAVAGAPGVDSFGGSDVTLTETTVVDATIVGGASTLTLNQATIEATVDVGYSSLLEGSGTLGAGVEMCGGVEDTSQRGILRANAPGLRLTISGVPTSIAGGDFEAVNDGTLLIDTDVTPASTYFCELDPCPVNLLAEAGRIFAGQDVIIMADAVTIGPAGSYESDPARAGANAAALHAKTITIHESLPNGTPGTIDVGGGMAATTTGNMQLEGLLAGSATSCTPPILNVTAGANVNVGGDLVIVGSAFIDFKSSQPMLLDGSFVNQSIRPEGFEWREGGLTMTAASGVIEAAGKDDGAAAQLAAEYELGTLTIDVGASVTVQDTFNNDQLGQGPCSEALYVDTLVIEAGATLSLNDTHVYYRNLVNNGTISTNGCGSLVVNPFCTANGQCDDDDRCTLDTCGVAGGCANALGGQAIVFDEPLLARSYCSDDNFQTCYRDTDCAAGVCLKLVCLWSEPNAFELASGTFTSSQQIGSYVEDFINFYDGIGFLDPFDPSAGTGYWYLVRPTCPIGASWQTVPGAEPGRDLGLP